MIRNIAKKHPSETVVGTSKEIFISSEIEIGSTTGTIIT